MSKLSLGKENLIRYSFKQALLECIKEGRPWAIHSIWTGNIVKHKEIAG